MDDIRAAMEAGSCVILLALDISAAFDTINHDILLSRLEGDYGITGTALDWIFSYISDRECHVAVGSKTSDSWKCTSRIPQGSLLGPLFFSLYVAPIAQIFNSHGIKFHQYADDTQLYTTVKPEDVANLQALVDCVCVVTDWFLINDLQLNADKIRPSGSVPDSNLQSIGKIAHLTGCDIKYDTSVKILGVQLHVQYPMQGRARVPARTSQGPRFADWSSAPILQRAPPWETIRSIFRCHARVQLCCSIRLEQSW